MNPVVSTNLDELGVLLRTADIASAVMIVDAVVEANGYAEIVRAALPHGVTATTHVIAAGEPSVATVDAAARAVRRVGRDAAVVAVGGGSALDVGKLAAAIAAADRSVDAYALGALDLPARRPLVAIPTTSGTGSETTRTCVYSTATGRKVWVWGDELMPDLILLDPRATVTMPPVVTAGTGLDAFVHAVEAASGQRSDRVTVESATHTIRLVLGALPAAVADGGDLDARASMQRAAYLGGTAIDRSGTGVAHAIGHALGSLAHVPHGPSVAIGLHAALDWNVAGAGARYDAVAGAAGTTTAALGTRFEQLLVDTGFADVVASIGDVSTDADAVAATMDAEENRPMIVNNARIPSHADHRALAEQTLAAWSSWRTDAGHR